MYKIFEPPMNHRDVIHQHIKLQTTMSTPITCLDQASLKINEKADVPNSCSPGIYRRISATKELLHEETTTVKLRHRQNSTKKLLKKFSTPRKSCGEILAEKFAESNHKSTPGWSNNHQDYQLGEVIGTGATATVHSAICIPRNEKCAIKRINLEKWNTSMDELLKEIQTMSACHHENVVTYYTSFVVKEELWLVIKLLAGGSLLDIIKHKVKTEDCYNGVFDEVTIATVMNEVLKGLEYFHNNGQIHRDIKAGNILLGANGSVQIADFGVSSSIATLGDLSRERSRHTFVGTPCWMAPEVMEQVKGYDFKADIWSFGITVIELITGTAPYHKYPPMKVLMLTLQNDPPSLESVTKEKDQYKDYGKSIRKLITDCLQKDPTKRPSATELLKHPFFKKAKDKSYLQRTLLAEIPDVEKRASLKRHKQRISDAKRYSESGDWKWDLDQDTKMESANNSSSESNQSSESNNSNKDVYQSDPFEQKTIKLTLRIRNIDGELNDILFEFKSHDTPEGVAYELIDDGLINNKDLIVIKSNLEKLINNYIITKQPCTVTFALNSNQSDEVIDEKTLLGFAQLSIAE